MRSFRQDMLSANLPEGFILLVEEHCEKSEGFRDLVELWYEAPTKEERVECEIDLFAMMLDRLSESDRRRRIDEFVYQVQKYGTKIASAQTQVPESVLAYFMAKTR